MRGSSPPEPLGSQPVRHDHFSDVARDYAAYRPAYPGDLFRWLADVAPNTARALDCASGSGQAAIGLAGYVETVVACDVSPAQLRSAQPHPSVSYVSAPAEQLPLASESCSLVVAAQALHWFDTQRFFEEAGRVLQSGGVVACWTYGLMRTEPVTDTIVTQLYGDTLRGYWPPERRLVEEGYASIRFPSNFDEVEPPAVRMAAQWTLGQVLGYIGTWSGLRRYRERTSRDPLPEVRSALAAAWGKPSTERVVEWPLAIRAARLR